MQTTTSENTADDDDTLSFLNVTGSVRDWLQLDQVPTKLETIEGSSDANEISNVMYITDWLPPEPFQCTEFTGVPT